MRRVDLHFYDEQASALVHRQKIENKQNNNNNNN